MAYHFVSPLHNSTCNYGTFYQTCSNVHVILPDFIWDWVDCASYFEDESVKRRHSVFGQAIM